MNNIQKLKEWFNKLDTYDQEEVLKFLYGKALIKEDLYYGPPPGLIQITEGLYTGPIPSSSTDSDVCPTCKKPW